MKHHPNTEHTLEMNKIMNMSKKQPIIFITLRMSSEKKLLVSEDEGHREISFTSATNMHIFTCSCDKLLNQLDEAAPIPAYQEPNRNTRNIKVLQTLIR